MSTRATPLWPFPGQEVAWWEHYPPHNLPPPRFAVGDCVETRWGRAVVISVKDYEGLAGRCYLVKHDWSSAPPGFGHWFGEHGMQPAGPLPQWLDDDDDDAPATTVTTPQASTKPVAPQLELFA